MPDKTDPLAPGSSLDRYEIIEQIGYGGMGEVYRALDTRLAREVAIKRLTPGHADQPAVRLRFEREARTISRISHPNICELYDIVGDSQGRDYLVMELLAGETVSTLIERGPVAVDLASRIAKETALALAAAHETGVVHRDIKPANIVLTEHGVKLLDFGVAKVSPLFDPIDSEGQPLELIANDLSLTSAGHVVGTRPYISPEQAAGNTVDGRSDLYSLGVVLIEMVAGRTLTPEESASRHGISIPDDIEIPEDLRWVIERCLSPRPADRFPNASALARALDPAASNLSALLNRPSLAIAAAVALALLTLTSVFLLYPRMRDADAADLITDQPTRRYEVKLPAATPLASSAAFDFILALSPDGTKLTYVTEIEGTRKLVLRGLDELEGRILEGTENARHPFFSPDGQWIGFYTLPGAKLRRVSIDGGEPIDIVDAPLPLGASWGDDGYIVYWAEFGKGLSRVHYQGGTPVAISHLDEDGGEIGHAHPDVLPGSRAVLFASVTGQDVTEANIHVVDLDVGDRKLLVEGAVRPRYLPTGHLLFAQNGQLLTVPFDLTQREITGEPTPVDEDRLAFADTAPTQWTFSQNGTLLYVPTGRVSRRARPPVWVSLDGEREATGLPDWPFISARISPEGRRVLLSLEDLKEVWLSNLDGEAPAELTHHEKLDFEPIWHPSGEAFIFASDRHGGNPNVYLRGLPPDSETVRLSISDHIQVPNAVTPDGQSVLFIDNHPETLTDIWIVDQDGSNSRPLIATPAHEGNVSVSPDGERIVFVSTESGTSEVYMADFPELSNKRQISTDGGNQPTFSADGKFVQYRLGDRFFRVGVDRASESPEPRPADLLFEQYFHQHFAGGRSFDFDPAGERFLLLTEEAPKPEDTTVIVVDGWLSKLRH